MIKTSHFFIGPGRSGTSWLMDCIARTNQVLCPRIKEPKYFDDNHHRGLDWYDNLYRHLPDRVVPMARVDFSNSYYLQPAALDRLQQYNPEARIIFIVRVRRDLFRSLLYFELRKGLTIKQIEQNAEQKWTASDLDLHIQMLRQRFGDRLVLIPFDWIQERQLHRIYTNIGLPDLKAIDSRHTNAHMIPRWRWLGVLSKRVAIVLRRWEWYGLLQMLKQSTWVRVWFFKQHPKHSSVPEIEALVAKFCGP